MQNHNQTWIFIFFHLVNNGFGIGCKPLVGHRRVLSFCTASSSINCCISRKCIPAVLCQNPIKHASNIHLNVFNRFFWTVAHGKSYRIIYKEILFSFLMWWHGHHIFLHLNLPPNKNPPKQVHLILPSSSHPPKQIQKTQTQLLTNFLSINPPRVKSPNHTKVIKFSP